jgi:hypothetical protein
MSCEYVQERVSSFLDGMLPDEDREIVSAHVQACQACKRYVNALDRVRVGVRRMPAPPIPNRLAVQLRVLASHERVRNLARTSFSARLEYWRGRIRLFSDNLMRPMALPIAGGVLSAALLFGLLVPNLSFVHKFTTEPPLSLSRDPDGRVVDWFGDYPRLESVDASFASDDNVIELTIDNHGRVADWDVLQGKLTPDGVSIIMMSRFTPAMFFYQPAWGKKLLVIPARNRRVRG